MTAEAAGMTGASQLGAANQKKCDLEEGREARRMSRRMSVKPEGRSEVASCSRRDTRGRGEVEGHARARDRDGGGCRAAARVAPQGGTQAGPGLGPWG